MNAFTEGEEGDGKTVDENGAEDDESDDGLDGDCQEFWLGLRVLSLIRVRQFLNGKGRDEYSA